MQVNESCYVVELAGFRCIVDRSLQPENGSRVLLDMSGMYEWGYTLFNPCQIVTDDGLILEDDLLEDVAVVGVVKYEVTSLPDENRPII